MVEQWLLASPSNLGMIIVSAAGVYLAVLVFTRLVGLRSFAKMSSFDFAMTIAVGSLLATTMASKDPPLLQGIVALGTLYLLQKVVAALRRYDWASDLVDNSPVLLMRGDEVIEDNLIATEVTHDDLRSKLREANVLELSQVHAVVFEATGDISVLHSNDEAEQLDDWLLDDVKDAVSSEAASATP